MAYNYTKLIGRIVEKCGTRANFARAVGLSERSISLKLNNKIAFKQTEIEKSLQVLGLGKEDVMDYFFTVEVQ